jgi:osmotically inducible protein OsmC
MALSNEIAKAGGTPRSLETQADVTLSTDGGGLRITGIKLTVRGQADDLDADGFRSAAEAAKAGCPVSKALTGTDITLDAQLDA